MKKKKMNASKKIGYSLMLLCGLSIGALITTTIIESNTTVQVENVFSKPVKRAISKYTSNLYFADETDSVDESSTYGYKWDKDTKTLTLSGLQLDTGKCPALELPSGSTIYLEKNTENTINLQDNAIWQDTTGSKDLGYNHSTAGIYVGNGTNNSTVNIVGYGSLKTTVGHVPNEFMTMDNSSTDKVRGTFGVCGNIVVGNSNGTDSPKVDIICNDDEKSFTLQNSTYHTAIQVLRKGCGFTLNNGNLHLKAGKAHVSAIMFQAETTVYNKGKIIFEVSKDSDEAIISYGPSEIKNSKNIPITVKDENGNDLTYSSGTTQGNFTIGIYKKSDSTKAYYVIIDISKQITLDSKSGGMQVGKAGEIILNYSTDNLEDGDTIGIEYYDPSISKYTTTLPTGMTQVIDTDNKKIKLVTEGKTAEGTYQFRLVLTASSTYDNQTFYSDDFNFIVGFEPTGNEYDSRDYKLEESDNPEKITEAITISASDGYSVSKDGENFSESVTYDEESSKENPKTHASLFIKRTSDDSVSEVEFDYSLDTTSPTASLGDKTSYVFPTTTISKNESVTISLSNVVDSLSEEEDIKKEYVILDKALTEAELKEQDESKSITWNTATSDRNDNDGNPIYDVNVSCENGTSKVVYVKITDEAGNVTYLASDIYSFDTVLPTISGLDEDTDYYVTTGFTVSEDATVTYTTTDSTTPVILTKNEDGTYTLPGDVSTKYTITVTDAAGNKSSMEVNMNKTESIASVISSLTEFTVTTDEEEDVQAVSDAIDSLVLSKATDNEKNTISNIKTNCTNLLTKISEVKKNYNAVEAIHNYSLTTVTSDDKTALIGIRDKAKALIDSKNLTDGERKEVETDYQTAIDLLNQIEDVEQKLDSITSAIGTLTVDTVKSTDEDSLKTALTTLETLSSDTYSGNLTENEKTTIASQKETIEALLTRISNVNAAIDALDSAVKDKTVDNVTSDDKESIQKALDDAKAVLSTNLTSEEKTALDDQIKNAEELIAKIDEVEKDKETINTAATSKTVDDVTSDDKATLTAAKEKAEALLSSTNLTEEEKKTITSEKTTIEDLLKEIAKDEAIASIDEKSSKYTDVNSVKSTDKEDIESIISNIDSSLTDYADNLTSEETSKLNDTKTNLEEYLTRIEGVADKITSVTDVTDKGVDTITSDDKAALDAVKTTVDDLLTNYSDNLTSDEKEALTAAKDKVDPLVEKINEVAEDISGLEETNKKYTPDTVTSDDKDDIQKAIDDAKALLDGSNLTETEKKNVQAIYDNLSACKTRIEEVKTTSEALNTAVEGKTTSNVTSDDKESIQKALDDAKVVLSTNLTSEEKTALDDQIKNAEELIAKIEEVETDKETIHTAATSKTTDNVTSADKESLTAAKEKAEALLSSANLTEEEKKTITSEKTTIEALLKKIDDVAFDINSVSEAIKDKTVSNVTSEDKESLEQVMTDIETLLDSENLTIEERETLTAEKSGVEDMLSKISEVNETISSIDSTLKGKTASNVSPSSKTTLEGVKTSIETLLASDNLTSDERESLTADKSTVESLLDKIDEIQTAISKATSALEGKTENNVKSSDETSLEGVKTSIDEVLETYKDNLTDTEKSGLADKKSQAQTLLDKISEVEESIASVTEKIGTKTVDNVKTSDKTDLTSAKTTVEELLASDNLTNEEETSLETKKTTLQSLLDKITEIEGDISSIDSSLEGKTISNVKSSDKTTLNDTKDSIDELLANEDNLTSEEITNLTNKKSTIDELLSKIDSVASDIADVKTDIGSKTSSNVTSDDKASLEQIKTEIDTLLASDNLTSEEKTALNTQKSAVEDMLNSISNVSDDIAEIEDTIKDKTTSNITSSDEEALNNAKETIEELLESDNLTDEEKTSLTTEKDTIDNLLKRIHAFSNAIAKVDSDLDSKSIDTIKSSDKSSIEATKQEIDDILTTYSDNLTSEEKAALNAKKETCNTLLSKIDNVKTEYDDVVNKIDSYNSETVKSSDKEDIEKLITRANALKNSNNLTDDELNSLVSKISKANSLLNSIKDNEKNLWLVITALSIGIVVEYAVILAINGKRRKSK